jgi:hypothetical protein
MPTCDWTDSLATQHELLLTATECTNRVREYRKKPYSEHILPVTSRDSQVCCNTRCRNQLLPFLKSAVEEKTDEVLHALAKAFGSLVPSLGGGEYAHLLVPMLEKLAEHEETVVRNNVSQSYCMGTKCIAYLPSCELHDQIAACDSCNHVYMRDPNNQNSHARPCPVEALLCVLHVVLARLTFSIATLCVYDMLT